MTTFAPAVLFALFLWWFSTGVLLYVDHLPRRTFRRSLAIASVLALAGCVGLVASSRSATVVNAYLGFVCALLVWAWHELTFLMGIVTGPRKSPCPPDAVGWKRFGYATATVIHHEVALALTSAGLVALTWNQPNQVGTATFVVLWVMRVSAKLNVFLGVQHLSTEFVPEHLSYMLSYFGRSAMNPLMPVSVAAGTLGVIWLIRGSVESAGTMHTVVATGFVATILALAVIEHVLLILPVQDSILWRWARRAEGRSATS